MRFTLTKRALRYNQLRVYQLCQIVEFVRSVYLDLIIYYVGSSLDNFHVFCLNNKTLFIDTQLYVIIKYLFTLSKYPYWCVNIYMINRGGYWQTPKREAYFAYYKYTSHLSAYSSGGRNVGDAFYPTYWIKNTITMSIFF